MIIKHKCSCGAEVEFSTNWHDDNDRIEKLSNNWLLLHAECRIILVGVKPETKPDNPFYKSIDNSGGKPV